MDTYFKNCGFEQQINDDTEIIYKTEFDDGTAFAFSYQKGEMLGTAELLPAEHICFIKISYISETRNIIPVWADRGALASGAYLGFYFNEVYGDFECASDKIDTLSLPFLNMHFSVQKTRMGKKYVLNGTESNKFEIDYKNGSSGALNTIPVMLITKYFSDAAYFSFNDAFNRSVLDYLKNSDALMDFKPIKNLNDLDKKVYIHIEEPELSLYPDAQCRLLNDIVKICFIHNTHKIGLCLSTHSPYIVNYLNLLIRAGEKKKPVNNAFLDFDSIAVYQIIDGGMRDLKIKNKNLINTNILSEPINAMYDTYADME